MSRLTHQQSSAVHGTGNLLLVAGAGTGKTHTLTARCLRLILEEHISVSNLLMVTFTEAAAAEMRGRLREALLHAATTPGLNPPQPDWIAEQLALLDTAPIGTLHSFCLQLAREHFHELCLDPQFTVLDETQTRPLQRAALDALLERHYAGADDTSVTVRELIRAAGRGADGAIRRLILKLHAFTQSLPNPVAWLDAQARRFSTTEPAEWRNQVAIATGQLRDTWAHALHESRGQAAALRLCSDALQGLSRTTSYDAACAAVRAIVAADRNHANWPSKRKTVTREPFKKLFDEASFLGALLPEGNHDPIAEDWNWARVPMQALLELVREFTADFAARKREFGGVDFADLEQCALQLLRDHTIATYWRERLAHVFVDEYQDINAAQDAILTGLSRSGAAANRFLVGDVKQSIYRFRLANPHIFQGYETRWRKPKEGNALSLTENFRSREAILDFINPLFAALLRPEIGGVGYEPLVFGSPTQRESLRNQGPRVEFHLVASGDESAETTASDEGDEASANNPPDLPATEREARLIAQRFAKLKLEAHQIWDRDRQLFRNVEWSDMAVLLRSPRGRAEAFAKEFSRLGIPLNAARDGFFTSLEVSDLLSLLRLLDNPLQDIPLAAVLRSPLVGLTMDELVEVRLADRGDLLWPALNRAARARNTPVELRARVTTFLDLFIRWRELARQASLSQTLETALHDTHYESLLSGEPRGMERVANVRRLLDLARQFDPYQRQGLYRFLRFVQTQEDEELDLEPAAVPTPHAVRLLSVHRSKGLEFPVVALACLGTNFNEQDQGSAVLLDEQLGLCPKITPPGAEQSYASLPHRLARGNARRELRGEELRLLYVAMTRARDTLILVGTTRASETEARWQSAPGTTLETTAILHARSHLDWLRLWLPTATQDNEWKQQGGRNHLLEWEIVAQEDRRFAETSPSPESHPEVAPEPPPPGALAALEQRLDWRYPHAAATIEAAKTSVTTLRRRVADETDDEAKPVFRFPTITLSPKTGPHRISKLSAAEVGIAHHTFQQHVDVARTATEMDLRNEAQALLAAGLLTDDQHSALKFADLAAFWQSPVGQLLRGAPADAINREMEFTVRLDSADAKLLPPSGLNHALPPDDFVVVQGQVDLAVILKDEIWLLDFKTDQVSEEHLGPKTHEYSPQLRVYAVALEKIYRRPVTNCWLHFFSARKTVEL